METAVTHLELQAGRDMHPDDHAAFVAAFEAFTIFCTNPHWYPVEKPEFPSKKTQKHPRSRGKRRT